MWIGIHNKYSIATKLLSSVICVRRNLIRAFTEKSKNTYTGKQTYLWINPDKNIFVVCLFVVLFCSVLVVIEEQKFHLLFYVI